jgi:hypothetical protein
VLLHAHQLFSHNAAEQSTLQSDICSAIYYIAPLDLSTKKYCDNSYYVRLYNPELQSSFGGWAARFAVVRVSPSSSVVRNSVNRTSDSTVNNALFGAETIASGEQKRQDQCALYLLVFKNTRDNLRVRKRKCPVTPCVPARLDRH